MQCQSNSLNPMPMQCQSNLLDSWDPVSIVQDSSQVWLLGRFPIYRETTEEPDLRWTNPIPMQCQSNSWNPMPMQCQSNSLDSWDPVSIVQDSSQVWLLGRFPIYRETTEEPDLRWTNPLSFDANKSRLAQVKDRKGTPFENFLRDLSTNERPAFQALDQSEASISARF